MALTGNMIADAIGGNPSIVNYAMFCAVFAMLSLLYLIPAAFISSIQIGGIVPLVLDALNTLFWFCGAVAFAAELHVHSCHDQVRPCNKIAMGFANIDDSTTSSTTPSPTVRTT